ncbi:Transcriptional activator HlyU [Rhizobium sp. PDO1-076]|nr:Transcriptional activator HlyU [Rhizobium sp. PDO1-076]
MTSIIARILSIFTGGSTSDAAKAPVAEPQVYKDCLIHAEPIREGSQYRLAGRIVKEVSGRTLERTFIRADIFPPSMTRSNARSARRSRSSIRTARRFSPTARKSAAPEEKNLLLVKKGLPAHTHC